MRPLLILATLACSAQATAATFAVTRFDDPAPDKCLPDDCSLREAVHAANSRAGRDRVLLDRGTYVLSRIGDEDHRHLRLDRRAWPAAWRPRLRRGGVRAAVALAGAVNHRGAGF